MNQRITFVITSLYKGGAETQLVRVATALSQRGWGVEIITLIPRNDFAPTLDSAGVVVRSLGVARGKYDPRALLRLIRLLRESRPQVVCTFMFHANVLGRVAAKLAGVRVIVSSIRNAIFGRRWSEVLMRWTDWIADVTTTNSELAATSLTSRGVVSPKRLRVMPNAVDISGSREGVGPRPDVRAELGAADGEPVWLSIGRLEPQKGHDDALMAVKAVKDAGDKIHLSIVGEGSLSESLNLLRNQLGLNEDVTFLGYRNDVHDLMVAADGLLLSSRWEGLPNVVLEALVAGLPVVATDVGGVRELIEDGVSGFVVPSGDTSAMAAAMRQMTHMNVLQREALTRVGKERTLAKYSQPAVIDGWEQLFLGLLETKAMPSR